jgi:hypothetical protein
MNGRPVIPGCTAVAVPLYQNERPWEATPRAVFRSGADLVDSLKIGSTFVGVPNGPTSRIR